MFNLSGSEIVVILLLALVVLGPDKLPDAMRKAGRTFAELKKMASGFQDEIRKGFDEPSAELRKTATTIRDAATVPGVTTRAKPSAKMAATTAPEAAAEPADYPDKPQHNPDVDPTPDLPPGNSVAAPVVAPAATAAAAAGLVGAATDDGATDSADDAADSADERRRPRRRHGADRRRCDRLPSVRCPRRTIVGCGRRSQQRRLALRRVRRPRRHRRRGRRRRSGPRCMMSPVLRRGASAPKPPRTPDAMMTLTEHLGELRTRIVRCALAVTVGAVVVLAFYDPVLRSSASPYTDLCAARGAEFCGAVAPPTAPRMLYNLDPLEGFGLRMRVGHVRRSAARPAGGHVADLAASSCRR